MKQSQRQPSVFFNLILFAGLIGIWITFAPAKIGGQASYIMVNGISMEPGYHTGDLVIVRVAEIYQVGDVVAYRDAEMGAYVIHRIIASEQGQIVLKGDNNSWIDAYHPTHDEIIGKQWIHAPKLARVMQWLRAPINLSLTIVLLGGVLMSSMLTTKSPQGQKEKNRPVIQSGGLIESTFYVLGFIFLVFLGLSIFGFTKPLMRTADKIPYTQGGKYAYSAAGTPGVYDNATVQTGEPVFPNLTCSVNMGLTYTLQGDQLQNVSGIYQMNMLVMDEQSGLQRTVQLIPQTAFSGNTFSTQAAMDLCQLQALLTSMEKQTGLKANTYSVQILTNVAFTAYASGQVVSGTFDPALDFKFDKTHLYMAGANQDTDPTYITQKGAADNTSTQANTIKLLGWQTTVGFIRVIALLGLFISTAGLGMMGWFVFHTAGQSEEMLIRVRYGALMMDINERSLDLNRPMVNVASIEDLAKLAERQSTVILHMPLGSAHYYLVHSHGAIYRYVLTNGKKTEQMEPVWQEPLGYLASNEGNIFQPLPSRLQQTAPGYVIHIENFNVITAQPEEKAMLGRVKI